MILINFYTQLIKLNRIDNFSILKIEISCKFSYFKCYIFCYSLFYKSKINVSIYFNFCINAIQFLFTTTNFIANQYTTIWVNYIKLDIPYQYLNINLFFTLVTLNQNVVILIVATIINSLINSRMFIGSQTNYAIDVHLHYVVSSNSLSYFTCMVFFVSRTDGSG